MASSKEDGLHHAQGLLRSDCCQKVAWFMMGVGFLFPYNSVVTAVDFFESIYFPSIDFALGWLLLAPSLLILCITLKYGYWGSIFHRIVVTLFLSSLLTIAIPLLRNPWILFLSTFALGCLTAVLQGTLFSLLGFLGSDLMTVTQTGIGCSGVLVGILRIITKYLYSDHDLEFSTYCYFGIAFVMVVVDIAVYVVILHPSKRVQDAVYLDSLKNESLHGDFTGNTMRSPNIDQTSMTKRVMHCHEGSGMLLDDRKRMQYHSMSNSMECEQEEIGTLTSTAGDTMPSLETSVDCNSSSMSLSALFCASWCCQIAVLLNYSLTLSLFPGVISLMVWNDRNDGWFAVIQILVFNLTDTVGKQMTAYSWVLNRWNPWGLLIASICRMAFIPLFVLCVKPLVFPWKVAVVINAIMGFTNGLVGTSGFCLGPLSPKVPEHEKGRTAQMLAVALTGGLVVGSSSAFIIHYVMDNLL